jgi:hypothetical protein
MQPVISVPIVQNYARDFFWGIRCVQSLPCAIVSSLAEHLEIPEVSTVVSAIFVHYSHAPNTWIHEAPAELKKQR